MAHINFQIAERFQEESRSVFRKRGVR